MANIELHGYSSEVAAILREHIRKVLRDFSGAGDVVITTYQNKVHDLKGNETPFMRVYTSDSDDVYTLKEKLKALNEDIEISPPVEWIPKK